MHREKLCEAHVVSGDAADRVDVGSAHPLSEDGAAIRQLGRVLLDVVLLPKERHEAEERSVRHREEDLAVLTDETIRSLEQVPLRDRRLAGLESARDLEDV